MLIPVDKPLEKRKSSEVRLKNISIIDIGAISLIENQEKKDWRLFISCRCFMAFDKKKEFGWKPVFRLRRALIDEVAHQYVTHARRPGVMRFSA